MSSQMWDDRYSASELVWSSTPNEQVAKFASTLSPATLWTSEAAKDATRSGWSRTAGRPRFSTSLRLPSSERKYSLRNASTRRNLRGSTLCWQTRRRMASLRTPLIWLWSPICSLLTNNGAAPCAAPRVQCGLVDICS